MIEVVTVWIALSVAVGMFANIRRNRNGIHWFLFALFGSPFLAFIFLAILREKPKTDVIPATRAEVRALDPLMQYMTQNRTLAVVIIVLGMIAFLAMNANSYR
jgi:hypothetical protein